MTGVTSQSKRFFVEVENWNRFLSDLNNESVVWIVGLRFESRDIWPWKPKADISGKQLAVHSNLLSGSSLPLTFCSPQYPFFISSYWLPTKKLSAKMLLLSRHLNWTRHSTFTPVQRKAACLRLRLLFCINTLLRIWINAAEWEAYVRLNNRDLQQQK